MGNSFPLGTSFQNNGSVAQHPPCIFIYLFWVSLTLGFYHTWHTSVSVVILINAHIIPLWPMGASLSWPLSLFDLNSMVFESFLAFWCLKMSRLTFHLSCHRPGMGYLFQGPLVPFSGKWFSINLGTKMLIATGSPLFLAFSVAELVCSSLLFFF